ncbi:MAG: exopolysaccharide Pel transporter PelG [Acidiferrobacter sp.]
MAGIGFELRKLMRHNDYLGVVRAYSYAGIIGAGPWVISILGVILLGFLSMHHVFPPRLISEFQTSVTYLIAVSLIFGGLWQLAFTRYVADRVFAREHDRVLPNLNGLLIVAMGSALVVAVAIGFFLFTGTGLVYRLLMIALFSLLTGVWVVAVMLTGLKHYHAILASFAAAYATALGVGLLLRPYGLVGLLFAFLLGQSLLFAGLLAAVYRDYPSPDFLAFDFLKRGRMYPSLLACGLLYNAAIWADKAVFWFTPTTSQHVIGPLRASAVYDLPIFLAYLSIIPGMAVFLMRVETDFVEYYDRFYEGVREGGSLSYIRNMRNGMVTSAKGGIFDIIKVQSLTTILAFVIGPSVLRSLGISLLYVPLFKIDVVGAGLQVALMGILNIFFYLDRRSSAVGLAAIFLALNLGLSLASTYLGLYYYGYGFSVSLLITVLVGLAWLDRDMEAVEYQTFMLQPWSR